MTFFFVSVVSITFFFFHKKLTLYLNLMKIFVVGEKSLMENWAYAWQWELDILGPLNKSRAIC